MNKQTLTRITIGYGTAISAITNLLIADWPNLSRINISETVAPNKITPDKSIKKGNNQ